MIEYEFKNVNPKNRKTCDCVIRAITVVSGKPYETVYRDLFEVSLKTGYALDEKRVYEKVLEKYGFCKYSQPKRSDNTKYTIGEFDSVCKSKIAVISCANHLTAVVDGKLVDIWDCRGKCISNYFTK